MENLDLRKNRKIVCQMLCFCIKENSILNQKKNYKDNVDNNNKFVNVLKLLNIVKNIFIKWVIILRK